MTTYPLPMIWRPARWGLTKSDPASLSPAGAEPLTLEELKERLRIEGPDEDETLAAWIRAARQKVEKLTNRALIAQTWTFKLSCFPVASDQLIELPGGTLQSVTSITYVDAAGVTQTWAPSAYQVDTSHAPGRVGLAYQQSWPTIREWGLPISITYVVGYGAAADSIPEPLRNAVAMIVGHWNENREDTDKMPVAAERLCRLYRIAAQPLGSC